MELARTMMLNRIVRAVRRTLAVNLGLLVMLSLPAFAADAGNGQKLYMAHCAGCHGEEGVSEMKEAPDLARFELLTRPDQTLIDAIRSGSNTMPPYLGILKDSEILDVISYLRTLY